MTHIKKDSKTNTWWIPLKIALIYAIFSALWILLSDQILYFLVQNPEVMTNIQMIKGWFFILTSALIIFFLLRREIRKYLKTEEALQESEKKFRAIFEQAAVGVSLCDSATCEYIKLNQRYCDIVGYEEKELREIDYKKITHPDDLEKDLSNMNLLLEGKIREYAIEKRYRKKDGHIVWVRLSVSPLWKPGEKPNYHIGIIEDITEQKEFGKQLLESESRLRAILEANPDPTVVYDKNGYPIFLNPSFASTFGWTLNDVEFKHIPFVPENQKKITALKINEIYASGRAVRFETKRLTRTGELKDVLLSASIVKLEQGKHIGLVVNLKDITESKKKEAQLRQTQKMETIGTLAGGIAHDFNNILSVIFGYSLLAKSNINDQEEVKQNIDQIIQGAQRAADLVNQILTFSRQTESEKHPLKVYLVLKESIKMIRATIPSTIAIKEKIVSKEKILADPTQLHQIIINLCTNAYHAMNEDEGVLAIGLYDVEISEKDNFSNANCKPGKYIKLEVSDTGCGIDEKIQSKVFDPFFTTKEIKKGTGLGLSVVDGIVKNHKGFIEFETKPGVGTTFGIYLPIINNGAHDPDELKAKKKLPTDGSERIMLVDDEQAILDTTKALLSRKGYQITTFTNGKSALKAFTENPNQFDLIIADMTMPQMTGDKLSMEALKIRKDIPIIICTGYHENFTERNAIKAGIKKYLQKPIAGSELAIVIRKLFDEK